MKHHLGLLLSAATCLNAQAAEPKAAPTAWKAGVASVVITPETPLWMAGYASRTKPAEGKETDLFAKALALQDERGTRLVLVTLDLIGVPRTLRKNLEKRCADAYKLPPEGLLLNASHTHSGPEFRVNRIPWDDGNIKPTRESEAYGHHLEERLFTLIGEALNAFAPSKLGYTHARAGFAMNRRLPTPKGYQNSPYPDGPVDQDVPVLRVEGEDGKLRAVVFGYACHNTSLSLYKWNADYAGYAQEYLQANHPGTVAMFVMGCGGDQNPYPRKTVEMAQQHGRALANAVETALSVAPRAVGGPLRAAYGEVDLDYEPIPTREEYRQRLESKDAREASHAKRFLDRLDAGETLAHELPLPRAGRPLWRRPRARGHRRRDVRGLLAAAQEGAGGPRRGVGRRLQQRRDGVRPEQARPRGRWLRGRRGHPLQQHAPRPLGADVGGEDHREGARARSGLEPLMDSGSRLSLGGY